MSDAADERWALAATAAALIAVDPAGLGGASLRALAGVARDAWLALLRGLLPAGTPMRRLPLNIAEERLLGGLDLAATLQAGRPISERGVLAQADGGVVLLPMAERVDDRVAAHLGAALDRGAISVARDGCCGELPTRIGVVAFDEGVAPDERPPGPLLDRLAFLLDLGGLSSRAVGPALHTGADVTAARRALPHVHAGEPVIAALCATATALGIASLRAVVLAMRAARCCAALDGRDAVSEEDATLAARLVLAPRATRLPAPETDQATVPPQPESEPEPEPEQSEPVRNDELPPDTDTDAGSNDPAALADIVLEAAIASIPNGLLSALTMPLATRGPSSGGKAGVRAEVARRGRPIGTRRGDLGSGARLDVIATLHAAAPWQTVRRATRPTGPRRIEIRREDFRVTRFEQRGETTVLFVVDASGSSALNRLAEAKGAVELLLADCYARRDRVAVLAFRGAAASLLLPPTHSLVRAKRSLAGLAGGGTTPLATAVDAAAGLADAIRRRGPTPLVILLTDGRANVARDGTPGRLRAADDARLAARAFRSNGFATLLIDTSPKPQETARALAAEMGGRYLPLPYAGSAAISHAVKHARSLPP